LAKDKAEKPKRELTKRQLSRWQQHEKRRHFIFTIGLSIVIVVLGILGVGLYTQWYIPERKPLGEVVIEVNDTKFDMDYYVKTLRIYTEGMTFLEIYNNVADKVIRIIEESELVRQEAMKLGISVSDDEVDSVLEGYNPPLSKDYRDAVRTQMLLSILDDEHFDKQVPIFAKQRHILAMFLESEPQANEVRARLEAGEDFAQLAGELSLETTSKDSEGDLGWQPEGMLTLKLGFSVVDEYAFGTEVGVLSQPVHDEATTKTGGYWLVKVIERDEVAEEAYVKVILLGNEQEANEVRARLEAGEDFAALAEEFSQHGVSKQGGGDWSVSVGEEEAAAIEDFVFSAELDVLSQPIYDDTASTMGGYWLIKVTEVDDNRQITDDDRSLLKIEALSKWVESLFNDPANSIKSYLDSDKKQWAAWHATGE
jgi:parvulin-like peptidyl-prolyl isomerase